MSRQSCATKAAGSQRSGPARRSPRLSRHSIASASARLSSARMASVDGILSERDIVIALADGGAELLSRGVDEIMTRNVVTCAPGDTVQELMAEMTNRRMRHLPVVSNGRLCGIVSIGDLVKNRLDE